MTVEYWHILGVCVVLAVAWVIGERNDRKRRKLISFWQVMDALGVDSLSDAKFLVHSREFPEAENGYYVDVHGMWWREDVQRFVDKLGSERIHADVKQFIGRKQVEALHADDQ